MKKILAGLSFGVMILGMAGVAQAAPITYEFSGVITAGGGTINVGTSYSGAVTFENSQPNTGDPNVQNYSYQSFFLEIAGENVTVTNGSFQVENDGTFAGDRVDIDFGFGSGMSFGGLPVSFGRLRLVNFSNTAISSADLPLNSNLDSWEFERITLYAQGVDIIGNLQTFTETQVPEPATLALLGFGLAGLCMTRRRKEQQAAV